MSTAQQAARAAPARRKATCPECGKVLRIASEGSSVAGTFPGHRQPEGVGVCPISGTRARKIDLVHPCKDCAALPTLGERALAKTTGEVRPDAPRPVKARQRCASHLREVQQAERERSRDAYRAKTYGITPAQFRELVDAQDGACACGLTHSRSRNGDRGARHGSIVLATDHDHDRHAECVAAGRHIAEVCCTFCVRGALGRRCNTEIVGRFTPEQLENLAAYMRRPTAQRIGWWDE